MTDSREDLVAFRDRVREKCGDNEFATSEAIAVASNIVTRAAYEIRGGRKSRSGKLLVDDAAERIFRAVKPRAKRCG